MKHNQLAQISLLSVIVAASLLSVVSATIHPEANLHFEEYCKHFGYPVQKHYVTTEDGYILALFRVQAKNTTTFQQGLQPFFMQHGLLDSSDTWIVNEESQAPCFILANKGYDVWLGNSRGNKYSRNHTKLDPNKNASYWDFTFQHMADYDLPAVFKYVSGFTGFKVNYIGHSQGTIQMHVALSKNNPVVESLLGKYFAFGPVAYVNHQESRLLTLLDKGGVASWFKLMNLHEFMPTPGWFESEAGRVFCGAFEHVCANPLKLLSDADPNLDNFQRMDVFVGHYPSGTSTVNMYHWMQIVHSGKFQAYDWGSDALNIKHYGQAIPPLFDLKKIRVPIRLFAGSGDLLADVTDVNQLWAELNKEAKNFYKIYLAGHATFMWGLDTSPWMKDLYTFI